MTIACASSDMVELAAKYTAGIVQKLPSLMAQAHRRCGRLPFLELNGYRFTVREEAGAQAVLELGCRRHG